MNDLGKIALVGLGGTVICSVLGLGMNCAINPNTTNIFQHHNTTQSSSSNTSSSNNSNTSTTQKDEQYEKELGINPSTGQPYNHIVEQNIQNDYSLNKATFIFKHYIAGYKFYIYSIQSNPFNGTGVTANQDATFRQYVKKGIQESTDYNLSNNIYLFVKEGNYRVMINNKMSKHLLSFDHDGVRYQENKSKENHKYYFVIRYKPTDFDHKMPVMVIVYNPNHRHHLKVYAFGNTMMMERND